MLIEESAIRSRDWKWSAGGSVQLFCIAYEGENLTNKDKQFDIDSIFKVA